MYSEDVPKSHLFINNNYGTADETEQYNRMLEERQAVNEPYCPDNIIYFSYQMMVNYKNIKFTNKYDMNLIHFEDELLKLISDDIVIVTDKISSRYKKYYKKENITRKVYHKWNKDITIDFSRIELYRWYHPFTQFYNTFFYSLMPDI
jgi:hypothetical protein